MSTNYQHVNYLWDDAVADQLDPLNALRYRSNCREPISASLTRAAAMRLSNYAPPTAHRRNGGRHGRQRLGR